VQTNHRVQCLRQNLLNGWQSVGNVQPTFLAQPSDEVVNPKPPDGDFVQFGTDES
jgi:hypothetical protein